MQHARAGDAPDPDEAMSAEAAAALLAGERARATRALEPDARLIYVVWGTAWAVAYTVTWLHDVPQDVVVVPGVVMALVWPVTMVTAAVVSIGHTMHRVRGLRGDSEKAGTMFSLTWGVAFVGVVLVLVGMGRAGVPEQLLELLLTVLPPVAVGILFAASAAWWLDWLSFALGTWLVLAGGLAALSGYPTASLVMAVLGGGGFLAAAAVASVTQRPCATADSPVAGPTAA